MFESDIKRKLLLAECKRWIGTKEEGTNSGQIVSLFQNWDSSPDHVAWCMAFVQFCLKAVDMTYDELNECESINKHQIFKAEHCLTVWNKTADNLKFNDPAPGMIAIWEHVEDGKSTGKGHTGIVIGTQLDGDFVITVEGNTGPQHKAGEIVREGDGVYQKMRPRNPNNYGPDFKLKGYLLPWLIL